MSTTIYDSPPNAKPSTPHQGPLSIDITTGTVWFFEHNPNDDEVRGVATVPLPELPAIYKAIGDYLGV